MSRKEHEKIPLGFGTMSKGLKVFLISFLGILVLFCIVVATYNKIEERELFENGVRVSACVLAKHEEKNGSRKNIKYSYYFELDLFVENADTLNFSKATNKKDPLKNFNEEMDALLTDSKNRMKNMNYKSYATVRVKVYKESYDKYSKGDKISVVHFKDDEKSTRLLEEIN